MSEVIGFVFSVLASAIIGVIFSDEFRALLRSFYFKFLGQEKTTLNGKWVATFTMFNDGECEEYTEVIELVQHGDFVTGHICEDQRNYSKLAKESKKRPLRVKGEFQGNYLTGHWYHPLQRHRFHGSFQVRLRETGDILDGMWLGFISNSKGIGAGDWWWERDDT